MCAPSESSARTAVIVGHNVRTHSRIKSRRLVRNSALRSYLRALSRPAERGPLRHFEFRSSFPLPFVSARRRCSCGALRLRSFCFASRPWFPRLFRAPPEKQLLALGAAPTRCFAPETTGRTRR